MITFLIGVIVGAIGSLAALGMPGARITTVNQDGEMSNDEIVQRMQEEV